MSIMKYPSYKKVAKKHLDACKAIIAQYDNMIPENVIMEIHYLSGYIIEGICVYAIYKHYEWDENKHIIEYDEDFTRATGLDYFKDGDRIINNRRTRTGAQYYIKSHGFKNYVELLHNPFQGTNIPYIDASSDTDSAIISLIDEWTPDIRYNYRCRHTQLEIEELVNTCEIIYNLVNQNI